MAEKQVPAKQETAKNAPAKQGPPPGHVRVADIIESPVALRGVDTQSEKFLQLVESIRLYGILDSVSVREVRDKDGNIRYGLVNGLQRFTAAKMLDLEYIPVNITGLEAANVLEAQIIANACRIETKPAQYSEQIMRILMGNPTLTLRELANKLCQSKEWLEQRLSLVKLDKNIQELVDEGKIKLTNAYALAKLPPEEQVNFADRAMTEAPKEFVYAATERAKEIAQAKRQGKVPAEAGFKPVTTLKSVNVLKEALTDSKLVTKVCENEGAKTVTDGFITGIKWALKIDAEGLAEQKRKYDEREAKRDAEKAKRKAEREAKKAEAEAEAAKKGVDLGELLGVK
jgi:ParB/RepB/Spo0J family partition protein